MFTSQITQKEILDALPKNLRGISIVVLEETTSTNDIAKEMHTSEQYQLDASPLDKSAELALLVVAERQTKGRGTNGRSFYSPSGAGIYMSLAFGERALKHFLVNGISFTSCIAVAVTRALNKSCKIEAKIKWINDLYLDDKKFCGILCEGSINPNTQKFSSAIVGIGINVTTECFPVELSEIATSISYFTKFKDFSLPSRNQIIAAVVEEIMQMISASEKADFQKEYLNEYRKSSCVLGRVIEFENRDGQKCIGRALDISDNGNLVVELFDFNQIEESALSELKTSLNVIELSHGPISFV